MSLSATRPSVEDDRRRRSGTGAEDEEARKVLVDGNKERCVMSSECVEE